MENRDRLTLWRNARLMTCVGPGLGAIERGALATQGGRIVYAGAMAELAADPALQSRLLGLSLDSHQ